MLTACGLNREAQCISCHGPAAVKRSALHDVTGTRVLGRRSCRNDPESEELPVRQSPLDPRAMGRGFADEIIVAESLSLWAEIFFVCSERRNLE